MVTRLGLRLAHGALDLRVPVVALLQLLLVEAVVQALVVFAVGAEVRAQALIPLEFGQGFLPFIANLLQAPVKLERFWSYASLRPRKFLPRLNALASWPTNFHTI